MFKVIVRNTDTDQFGVLDTSDFVVEFYDFADLRGFIKQGIKIEGIIKNGSVWDVSLQRGVIPQVLMNKIKDVAYEAGGEEEYVHLVGEITSYYLMLQKSGENLLKLGKKVKPQDIRSIIFN